ncbi:MAG: D-alanyl-D-alanine carboxypeptidase/D-alanyl-D-alanine-endopeptidase [Leptolyngbyaceae cyanobacterium SL_5_9]|nr:D-alanyl-D-alanine carboxypeptidase/D-alanyl-D-alanine-endopeptidase [Leptolyngbyaceae cyanobacterium SL_5_9]
MAIALSLGLTTAKAQTAAAKIPVSVTQAESEVEPEICPVQLANELQAIATRPEFQRSRWGISIQTLATGETLYEQESQRYFIPASTAKLLTTAAALHQLGSSFQIRTSVYQVNDPDEVVLRVVGQGDPSFTDVELRQLIQQIGDRHITHIDRLIGDDQYFQGEILNPNWEWEDVQAGYGAGVNSLILNLNAIALSLSPQAVGQPLQLSWSDPAEALRWQVENHSMTVAAETPEFLLLERQLNQPTLRIRGQLQISGEPEIEAIAIPDPSEYFLRRFRQILVAEGISVSQVEMATIPHVGNEQAIATVTSAPLSELLIQANRESENLYAEALLRILGAQAGSTDSTLAAGIAAVETILVELGVNPDGYALADGSGLSRHNLVSPEALVQVLRAIAQSPEAEVYRESLAIAGVNGTLQNRFRETPIQGRLFGKTGTASGIVTLSGYLELPDYQPVVFSILVNQSDQPVRIIRQAIDEMVLKLAQLRSC